MNQNHLNRLPESGCHGDPKCEGRNWLLGNEMSFQTVTRADVEGIEQQTTGKTDTRHKQQAKKIGKEKII